MDGSYGHFRFGIGNFKCHFDTEGSRASDAPGRIEAVSSSVRRALLNTPAVQLFVPVLIDELLLIENSIAKQKGTQVPLNLTCCRRAL